MRVVNVKELKARLSAYLREVDRGETFLVTDRSRVVARLAPPEVARSRDPEPGDDRIARLVALGARPPSRARRPADYRRVGPGPGLAADRIQELVDWVRGERD